VQDVVAATEVDNNRYSLVSNNAYISVQQDSEETSFISQHNEAYHSTAAFGSCPENAEHCEAATEASVETKSTDGANIVYELVQEINGEYNFGRLLC